MWRCTGWLRLFQFPASIPSVALLTTQSSSACCWRGVRRNRDLRVVGERRPMQRAWPCVHLRPCDVALMQVRPIAVMGRRGRRCRQGSGGGRRRGGRTRARPGGGTTAAARGGAAVGASEQDIC